MTPSLRTEHDRGNGLRVVVHGVSHSSFHFGFWIFDFGLGTGGIVGFLEVFRSRFRGRSATECHHENCRVSQDEACPLWRVPLLWQGTFPDAGRSRLSRASSNGIKRDDTPLLAFGGLLRFK